VYQNLAILAILILLYSLLAGRIEKTALSGPIVFVILGLLIGPLGLNILTFTLNEESYKTLAELALALVLFTDASKTNLSVLENNMAIPIRLLFIGLPLTILLGLGVGFAVFKEFLWVELAILATILSPTDAALGKPVVSNKMVPSKIREGLNVESGLNDGICVPVLFLLMALFAAKTHDDVSLKYGLLLFAKEIGFGVLVGLVITFSGERLINFCFKRQWIDNTWKPIIIIALALSCFSVAQILGGSSFIACFVGGVLYGTIHKTHKVELLQAAEGTASALGLIVWIIFGSVVVSNYISEFTWPVILYSILSLTVIRTIPVLFSLYKSGLTLKNKLFVGWFGPRGLASIVFVILILDLSIPHQRTIVPTVVCTVLFSIIAHGLSANPTIKKMFTA